MIEKKYIFLLIASVLVTIAYGFSQETHFKNSRQYLKEALVQERTTWDVTDSVTKSAIDKYDERGNKTEAIEIYEGKNFLKRFNGNEWVGVHTTTCFRFKYDEKNQQTEQKNDDYNPRQQNSMYQYDSYGNIERWKIGRSFENPRVLGSYYDHRGNVIKNYHCWAQEPCIGEQASHAYELIHHLKYNENNLLIQDLVNYFDGMAGKIWEYTINNNGQILSNKEYHVNSYFGLDHDTPTVKDIDHKSLSKTWEFEYDSNGKLTKETRKEPWMGVPNETVFTYNKNGLIIQAKMDDKEMIDYVYNDKNILLESVQYNIIDGPKKPTRKLKYEYIYR